MATPSGSPAPGKPHTTSSPYSINIVKDYSVAGSGNPDIIQITVSPVPNPVESLTFNISGSSYTPILTTDPITGAVTLSFSSSTVGPVTVTVTDPSGNVVITQVLNFIAAPGPPDPAHSYLTVITSPVTANGVARDEVDAVLYDSHGNLVSDGTPVDFSILSGTATLSSSGTTTGGTAKAYFTSTVASPPDVQVQGFINGTPFTGTPLPDHSNPANNYVTIQFTTDIPDGAHSTLVVDVGTTTANGTSTDQIHAIIRDANGNLEKNTTVTMTWLIAVPGPIDGTAIYNTASVTVTTDANGNTPIITIANTKTGTVQMGATVNGLTITGNSPAPVNFVSGPPDLSQSSLVVDISTTADDGTSIDQIHAHLVDAFGNLVDIPTSISFIFSPTGPIDGTAGLKVTTAGGGPGGTYTLTPDASGNITLTITNTQVGSVNFGATVNGGNLSNGSPAVVHFVDPNAPDPTNPQTALVVDIPSTTADGVSIDQIHVHLVTVSGANVTEPVTVQFYIIPSGPADATANGKVTTAGGGAGLGPYTLTPDASGNVTLTISDINVGNVSFGVTVNGTDIPNGKPAIVQFVTGAPVPGDPGGGGGTSGGSDPGGGGPTAPGATGYTVEFVVLDHRLADGSQKDSVAAYVTDAYKHPVDGADIQFTIMTLPTAGTATAGATMVGGPDVLSKAGYCGVAVTSTKPGTVFIVATLNGVPIDNSYRLITFDDAPDVNNPETYIRTIIYEALADGTQQTEVKVHVVSLDGSIMSGQDVTFTVDSGNAQIVTPQPVQTDLNGDAFIYLTSTKPGIATVTATVDNLAIKNGSPARVKFAGINIYVPKVFTPNGDGTNDVLKPILVGIQTFHYFSVYNRWGNLVFTTQDPNQGWDGTFKGVPQPVETYLWIAEGISVEGKKIVQKGMVSLVK